MNLLNVPPQAHIEYPENVIPDLCNRCGERIAEATVSWPPQHLAVGAIDTCGDDDCFDGAVDIAVEDSPVDYPFTVEVYQQTEPAEQPLAVAA
jgi:hypothetical protein